MKAKKWVLVKAFDGEPKESDIEIQEEELPALKDNEILCAAEFLSVDPYMRPYMKRFPVPSTMIGGQVARVLESKNKDYPVGQYVVGQFGWRTHTVTDPSAAPGGYPSVLPAPDIGDLPKSLALGTIGMPGMTAYFGLLKLCEPKEGETVLVNAAAGAVGNIVGQIAKIKGCRVVGCAGNDDKCKWLKELGFDYVFNYKTQDLDKALKEGAPDGVDCFFDNVGGLSTVTILANHMNTFGRVAICGAISMYNDKDDSPSCGPYPFASMIFKQIRMEGFLQHRWIKEFGPAVKEMTQWVQGGRIKYREHVTEGFENMQKAFYGMLKGENTGKAVVKV